MAIKFFKMKDTEIRKAVEVGEDGKAKRVLGVIGRVDELLKHEVIFPDNTTGNGNKWLVILPDATVIAECLDLQPAKDILLHHYSD